MELPTEVPRMQAMSQGQSVSDKSSISGDMLPLDRLGTVSTPDPAKALPPTVWSRKWRDFPRAHTCAPLSFAKRQALKQRAALLAAPCSSSSLWGPVLLS